MKKIIGTTAFTIGVTSLVILAALVWIVDRRETNLDVKRLEKSIDGISAVGVRYDGDEIFLTVHSERLLTCDQVYKSLGVDSIVVRGRVYEPRCNVLNGKLIEIVYRATVGR